MWEDRLLKASDVGLEGSNTGIVLFVGGLGDLNIC